MEGEKLAVFIGSSKEGLSVAQAVQLELKEDADCTIWYQGVFGLSEGTLESLEIALSRFQYAILVLTPDDMAVSRDQMLQMPRDNVLFELGLFMGRLGRKRVFIVCMKSQDMKLPSDLAGISIGYFHSPCGEKPICSCPPIELLPSLGPVVTQIRSSISRTRLSHAVERKVYYIAPSLAHNAYFAHLQNSVESALSRFTNLSWHFRLPHSDSAYDMYMELESILQTARVQDAVIMVPKDLQNEKVQSLFDRILEENGTAQIVLIDQPPPRKYLCDKRISFVGVDNRKVGILAAFVINQALSSDSERLYCAVLGPGGRERHDGFVKAIELLDSESIVETLAFGDVDRIQSLPKIAQLLSSLPKEVSVGIFAGNDEVAVATIETASNLGYNKVKVVGCDATREMRLAVDTKPAALATIETNLRQQAELIVQSVQTHLVELFEPTLYPINLNFRRALRGHDSLRAFWDAKA